MQDILKLDHWGLFVKSIWIMNQIICYVRNGLIKVYGMASRFLFISSIDTHRRILIS
jgi:hypothetical protein